MKAAERRRRRDKQCSAYHEAGHAVALLRICGWGSLRYASAIDKVTMPTDDARPDLRGAGIVAYSGAVAELMLCAGLPHLDKRHAVSDLSDLWLSGEAQEDAAWLAAFARSLGRSRPANRLHWPSWEAACRLIERERSAVVRVANALLREGQLDGGAVEALVRRL